MTYCILKNCKNDSKKTTKDQGVTFHRFLREGHPEREKWIKFVQKNRNENTWLPNEYTCICSLHFKDEDKQITKTGRVYLKKTAIPFDSNSTESVSDAEAMYDIKRIRSLKKALAHEVKARKMLASKLKKIRHQNRYLKNRCESYKVLVKSLKNRFLSLQTGSNLKTQVVNLELEEVTEPEEVTVLE